MNARKTGLLFLTLIIAIGIMLIITGVISALTGNQDIIIIAQFMIYPVILTACLIFAFISKEKISDFFGFRKIKISTFFLTILFCILIFPIIQLAGSFSNLIFGNPLAETVTDYPVQIMLILTLGCAPFFEELLFRGAIYQGYRKSGRVWGSILLTALLFGLFHGNLTQLIYTAFLGIFLAMLTDACGSLWMPMLAHFLFNFSGTAMELILSSIKSDTADATEQPTELTETVTEYAVYHTYEMVILFVFAAIALGISILFMFLSFPVLRKISRIEQREDIYLKIAEPTASTGYRLWSFSLFTGIGIALVEIAANIFIL